MNPYTYIKSLFQDWRRRQVERQLALISLQYERAVMESRKRGDTEHLQKISAAMTVLRNEVKEW